MDGVKRTLNKVVIGDFHMPRYYISSLYNDNHLSLSLYLSYLSPDAQDLITSLLKKHPSQRLSLSQILEHSFMRPVHSRALTHPHSVASLDSGHATMSSTTTAGPITLHSSPHTTTGRGPLRATLRPRGLITDSHHHQQQQLPHTLSHRRSHSLDSIRKSSTTMMTSSPETTPTNHHPQPHSTHTTSTSHHSSQHLTNSTRTSISSTRANNKERLNRCSNKENTPTKSIHERGGGQRGSENLSPLKTNGSSGIPFKDRTNTSQSGMATTRQEQRRVIGKGNSLSELAPPLNAARLRPIHQSTRTATVRPSLPPPLSLYHNIMYTHMCTSLTRYVLQSRDM